MKAFASVLLFLFAGVVVKSVFVHEDVSRMGDYEIIEFDIDIDSDNSKVSFVAFGNKYELSLQLNKNIIGNNILDHHGRRGGRGELSELVESCHYHVKFVDGSSNGGYGGLSLCPGDGLRARLIGFDDTLIIGASKRYFDIGSGVDHYHKITDKHIAYRMSDYDYTDIPHAEGRGRNIIDDGGLRDIVKDGFKKVVNKQKRGRKLLSSTNKVGLYVVCDPSMYSSYYSNYGSSWESQMFSDAASYVNDFSSEYENADWGSSVGTINVVFSKFDALTSFSGNFASLNPGVSSNTVNGNTYLDNIVSWSASYVNFNSIDNVQIWTKYSFSSGAAGLGWVSKVYSNGYVFESMCSTTGYSSSNNVLNWGYDWGVRTMAHEMGHNFGAEHDQDTTCGINAGLMGYGNGEGFSYCSRSTIANLFNNAGYECLDNSATDISGSGGSGDDDDDDDDNNNGDDDDDDDNNNGDDDDDDDNGGSCSYYSCLTAYNLFGYSQSFTLTFAGCYGNYASYYGQWYNNNVYLYRSGYYTSYWFVNFNSINDYGWSTYCYGQTDPTNCDGSWSNGYGGSIWSSSCRVDTASYNDDRDGTTTSDDSSDDHEYSMNCTNPYGDSICFYNDGSLWNSGIASFDFYMCKDGIPAFMYKYTTDNTSTIYILHYEDYDSDSDNAQWLISKNSLSDLTGEAFCTEEDLTKCVYDKWFVQTTDEEDIATYLNDESMGYDANCKIDSDDTTDNKDGYCGKSNSCALWTGEYSISDSTSSSSICTDEYLQCISLLLNSDFSVVTTSKKCDGDSSMDVIFNVTFSGSGGYSSYNDFVSQYESIFEACDDNNNLDINVEDSNLLVCDECNFMPNNSTNDESSAASMMWTFGAVLAVVMTAIKI